MTRRIMFQDSGLIIENQLISSSMKNDLDETENFLSTLKQYRDYYAPNSESWEEYIFEMFHLFGFAAEKIGKRQYSLKSMGSNSKSDILMFLLMPDEDFTRITPWLDWNTFILYSANYHTMKWVVLTNGLEIKIINVLDEKFRERYIWANVDGVLQENRIDSFYKILKSLDYIKNSSNNGKPIPKTKSFSTFTTTTVPNSNSNPQVKDVYRQTNKNEISNPKIKSERRVDIPTVLNHIFNVIQTMHEQKTDFQQACNIVAERLNITYRTVKIACTNYLHIKEEAFIEYQKDKTEMILLLGRRFPKNKPDIHEKLEEIMG